MNMDIGTVRIVIVALAVITLALISSVVGLTIANSPVPDAFWGLLGACVGGITGVLVKAGTATNPEN